MIYSVIDTILQNGWVPWSEGFLSRRIENPNHTHLSFFVDASTSNASTRANEFYRMGILRYPLTNTTKGFELLKKNENLQTPLGFIGYSISKALITNGQNQKLLDAYKAFCAIVLIQQFSEYQGRHFGLNTLFQYVLRNFPKPHNIPTSEWYRYLSAGMFCCLNGSDEYKRHLLIPFFSNRRLDKLFLLFRDDRTPIELTTETLPSVIESRLSFNGLVYEKGSQFFIGGLRGNTEPKGFYYQAYLGYSDFISDCATIEQASLDDNPFKAIYFDNGENDVETPCVITEVKSIFNEYLVESESIHILMKSLEQGTLEAIKLLSGEEVRRESTQEIKGYNKIYFGAPGSGKSREVENIISNSSFTRTTFHPDSDYASFIGTFKPNVSVSDPTKITYSFTPQAFTNAYLKAWSDLNSVHYLVIEEINRGNCAQIFGDIFQCLDRNVEGYSKYTIDIDSDLANYIETQLISKGKQDVYSLYFQRVTGEGGVKRIALPPNLVILATMNTSDQSLFPMDSAFKRRWDWEFIPIDYEDAETLIIVFDDSTKYNWGKFIKNINSKVRSITDSEDKQLGNRFVNPPNGIITFEQFRSKVLFFLWYEVYKDEVGSHENIFQYVEGEENKTFQYSELFTEDDGQSYKLAKAFMKFNQIAEMPTSERENENTI
jgi:hypothetical protein